MTEETWAAVDRYIDRLFARSDPALDAAQKAAADAGMPMIHITANQGKLLQILARSVNARLILEIGTLAGYSAIWLARALPAGGRLLTIESDPKHAEVARANIARAGLAEVVEVRLGNARETLPEIAAAESGRFDLVFIDADKSSTADYFRWALRLTRPGGLIVCDNVVRNGAVADSTTRDPGALGMRRFIELLAAEPGVSATVVQTVGSKGYDGFAVAVVTGELFPGHAPGRSKP